MRSFTTAKTRIPWVVAWMSAAALTVGIFPSCAELQAYSRRVAREECSEMEQCLVYDWRGRHESPCFSTPDGVVYPGDSGWPFEPGICDSIPDSNTIASH